jgi:hypothetical protein
MEILEDKIVRNKLGGMDTLPEGYAPNLESKWSMLEAGLNGNSRKTVFAWKPYAVAAMLLILGGAALILMRPKTKTVTDIPSQQIPATLHQEPETEQQITKAPGKHKPKTIAIKKSFIPRKDHTVAATQDNDNTQPAILPEDKPIVQEQLITAIKVKKPRFVEVDFYDAPITAQKPTESVIAAQQFKFRLGRNSVSVDDSKNNNDKSIRLLQQSFN